MIIETPRGDDPIVSPPFIMPSIKQLPPFVIVKAASTLVKVAGRRGA
jgi:hypothetical protein